jgi:hypothetical protein
MKEGLCTGVEEGKLFDGRKESSNFQRETQSKCSEGHETLTAMTKRYNWPTVEEFAIKI